MSMNVNCHLLRDENIAVNLTKELSLGDGEPYRRLTIEKVYFYITTKQAIQIANAIQNQMIMELPEGKQIEDPADAAKIEGVA